jgi:hypothetical protein
VASASQAKEPVSSPRLSVPVATSYFAMSPPPPLLLLLYLLYTAALAVATVLYTVKVLSFYADGCAN